MQSSLTACKHLLIPPVLFLMLQVSLALHHHHFDSFHDDEDSLHSFPSAFYPDHIKLDTLICLAPEDLIFSPSCARLRNPDSPEAASTVLVTDPSQSRAPPPAQLS